MRDFASKEAQAVALERACYPRYMRSSLRKYEEWGAKVSVIRGGWQRSVVAALWGRQNARRYEVISLATHPMYRGRGYARRLLRRAERRALSAGLRALFLDVREIDAEAQWLYLSEGFTYAPGPRPYPDVLRMIKHLV